MLKNSVRIIGGQWRGRQIAFNPGASIRPTPDRVRETLFNWLMGQIAGTRCLDLFSGSGILGLEALSRGAAFVYSIEKDSETLRGLKAALELLKANPAHWQLMQGDALAWLQRARKVHQPAMPPFDIIFIDPPYDANLWAECLSHVHQNGWLSSGGSIYLESNRPLTEDITAAGFEIYKEKKAGSVYAYLATPIAS